MMQPENRFTLFGIMLWNRNAATSLKPTGKPWHVGTSRAANASPRRRCRVALGKR
ncbi:MULTISPECIES: hypothetical protein [unclassified Mesorhizobium]|uniref:hypothetical protein n=1 Tax=unclassified Mesorhizobium TaxID=325217 RepID=UPI0015E287DE|nr:MULTISPECIES: hypothetical protein [unclassified Mesorhizobium]